MCLVLIFTFTFVKPKEDMEKAEAVIPIAAWAVSIIGGLIIDIAVDMGVKFIDKKAKEGFKNKILNKIWAKNGDLINELKPTKKNGLKWLFKAPKWLLTIITGAVSSEIINTKEEDDDRTENISGGKPVVPGDGDSNIELPPTDPFYNTSISMTDILPRHKTYSQDKAFAAYMKSWLNYKVTPSSYKEMTKMEISGYKNFSDSLVFYVKGGSNFYFEIGSSQSVYYPHELQAFSGGTAQNIISLDGNPYYRSTVTFERNSSISEGFKAFEVYLIQLEQNNKKIYYADGLLVSDYKGLIKLPQDLSASDLKDFDYTKLPPKLQKDRDIEFEIKNTTLVDVNQWDLLKEGDEFEWTLIENEIVSQGDTIYNVVINNDYNPTINNEYEVDEETQNDIDNMLPVVPGGKPPATGEGTGSGGMVCTENGKIIPCDNVEKIDGSLLAYVKNSYEYATNFVKTAVDGLKALGTGAVELTKLYGIFFGWLPKEIVILMTSGLGIMLGLRIFRK